VPTRTRPCCGAPAGLCERPLAVAYSASQPSAMGTPWAHQVVNPGETAGPPSDHNTVTEAVSFTVVPCGSQKNWPPEPKVAGSNPAARARGIPLVVWDLAAVSPAVQLDHVGPFAHISHTTTGGGEQRQPKD
jgi:hypothetical protein